MSAMPSCKRESNLTPNYILLILLVAFALGPLLVLWLQFAQEPGRDRAQSARAAAQLRLGKLSQGVG